MPREIKAYECEFCNGKMYRKTRKSIEDHEPRCINNPARKTCKTCWHNEEHYEQGSQNGWLVAAGFLCRKGHKPEGVKLVWDCENWLDTDEGQCNLVEVNTVPQAVGKLMLVQGTVQ